MASVRYTADHKSATGCSGTRHTHRQRTGTVRRSQPCSAVSLGVHAYSTSRPARFRRARNCSICCKQIDHHRSRLDGRPEIPLQAGDSAGTDEIRRAKSPARGLRTLRRQHVPRPPIQRSTVPPRCRPSPTPRSTARPHRRSRFLSESRCSISIPQTPSAWRGLKASSRAMV